MAASSGQRRVPGWIARSATRNHSNLTRSGNRICPGERVLRNSRAGRPVPLDVRDETVGTGLERELERLYREHGERLWRSLVLSMGSRDVADDAVAEAFAQALARGGELRDPLAWIWRAAFRVAAGELKARAVVVELSTEIVDEMPEPVVDLIRALGTLTRHQRVAIVLADYAGYSHREIAEILGSSVSAVGVHVHRARRRLRPLLEAGDD